MIDEWRCIVNDLEGSGRGLIKVLSQHLHGGTKENHNLRQDTWCCDLESNRAPPEYLCVALSLDQPVQWFEPSSRRSRHCAFVFMCMDKRCHVPLPRPTRRVRIHSYIFNCKL
jgi:hypothetical protein